MVCTHCGRELANPQARFCGHCGTPLAATPTSEEAETPRTRERSASGLPLMITAATAVLAIVAFFIYLNRPGPCDSIFEQTAPTLGTSLHFLKTSGELVVGRDKIQDLTDGAQRLGILCKNCCIEQLSGRINAEQYKDCMETVKGFETQAAAVASSVSAVDTAKQHGQVQLVSEKTQQAELGASTAIDAVQKLTERIPALAETPAAVSANSPATESSLPPKAVNITKSDGTVLWVYDDGFYFNNYSDGLHLESGQSVDYPKVKAIDVLGVDNGKQRLRITIVGGKTIDGTEDGYAQQTIGGKNDLGAVDVPVAQVKRVAFPH